MSANQQADVVVIGGGPAGSTVATLLAQQGCQVQLFEREAFPRYHIGESLIPETYWVLQRLKLLDKMRAAGFVKKHSVQFVSATGRESAPFYFEENKQHESSQTWQVIRSQFDALLLDNARAQGVTVHHPARVLEVLFEEDQAVGVRVQENGVEREVRARVVVDASGQSAMLQNRFKLRVWDPVLMKGAIWTYWRGAVRDTGRDEGATLVVQTTNRAGWWWYIPQHDDTISVGVVAPFDALFKGRGSHEQVYNEELAACPAIQKRVAPGERSAGFYATKDYSYRSRQVAGDGWVLVGDAFGFLDPLYSSGVMLALKSGELAADAIVAGLSVDDVSAARIGAWGPAFNKGVDRMRRLVCEYYDGFSFGKFVKTFPHLKGTVTDLLIGDLFDDRVDEVWGPLESLYPPDKQPIPAWSDAAPAEATAEKVHELFEPTESRAR